MGKSGKARKKLKLDSTIPNITNDVTDEGVDSEISEDEEELSNINNKNIQTTIVVFDNLMKSPQLFFSKRFKSFRQAAFPLLNLQASKHFELDAVHYTHCDISERSLSTAIRVLIYLSKNLEIFSSLEFKPFRKAFHYLVKLRDKGSCEQSPLASKDTRNTEPSFQSSNASDSCSLSNRISACFRQLDWEGALLVLREMAVSSEEPKLGSLQRWVRDCDIQSRTSVSTNEKTHIQPSYAHSEVTAMSSTDAATNTSILLLDAVLRVMSMSKRSTSDGGEEISYGQGQLVKKRGLDKTGQQIQPGSLKFLSQTQTASKTKKRSPGPPVRLVDTKARIIHFPPFAVPSPFGELSHTAGPAIPDATAFAKDDFLSRVRVVSHVPGPQRRPPSQHDLNIYTTKPGSIIFSGCAEDEKVAGSRASIACATDTTADPKCASSRYSDFPTSDRKGGDCDSRSSSCGGQELLPSPGRHHVPHVPGAMLLTGVLTPHECSQFISAAEALGYSPDAVDGIDNIVWLADSSLVDTLFQRCCHLLPQTLHGHSLVGINARWRLFRYLPGAVYRPHIDGSWTGNGLDPVTGELVEDIYGNSRSRLTFLVYLNGDFEGGATTFFVPSSGTTVLTSPSPSPPASASFGDSHSQVPHEEGKNSGSNHIGCIEAYGVEPQQGAVLVFPHGDALCSLVHEGSAVVRGAKYIIRSDVLYTNRGVR